MKRPLATTLFALAVTGLIAGGAATAQADDDNTVVYVSTYAGDDENFSGYFATIDPETLHRVTLASFPWVTDDDGIWLTGIEVYNGDGYAIRGIDGGEEDIFSWDITTGQQTAPVELTYTDAGFFDVEVGLIETWALDATTDGRILAIGYFSDGSVTDRWAVIEVDSATGAVTPVVDLTTPLLTDTFWYQGIATDPTTDTTYLLGYRYESGETNEYPAVATPVDLAANTVGSPIFLPSYPSPLIDDINEGDFNDSGVLYVLSADGVLGRFASPLAAGSAFENLGSPNQLDEARDDLLAVTGSTTPTIPDDEPELAATGVSATPLTLGALGALAAGGLALAWVAGRRRRA